MAQSRYIVGIDLGTTHTVVAFAPRAGGKSEIRLFEIEQLVAPGEVATRPLLPSLRYHAAAGELAPADLQLPWPQAEAGGDRNGDAGPVIIGSLARTLGAQVPGRLVASAKSWLSHAAVDRLAPILPWGAAEGVPKVSPVAASASYLAYLRQAWDSRFPKSPLAEQDIVLTVPASFDEAARALTLAAAREAGLADLRLLEEPQAAFYDWLFRHRETLNTELADARLVLVCDVGGGTTDLSLIQVEQRDEGPVLTRIGVGNHLMLGGDNMDLALAHQVEQRLKAQGAGQPLSAARLSQLVERCRAAKEQLLADEAPDRAAITLLGSGSRLIGGTRSVELLRDEVQQLVVDGFFPRVAISDMPRRARAGLVEFGLPYANDAAVTRHVAGFLQQHAAAARQALGGDSSAPAIPDSLLLNGGVFRAPSLAQRLQDTLADWRGQPLQLLHNDNPDVAVARGAVAYALAQREPAKGARSSGTARAPRIGGGSPRSYFLLLDSAAGATRQAICVLPRGTEPGKELRLSQRSFALRLGQPVRFHLLSSTAEAAGQAPPKLGDLIDPDQGEYSALPPIASVMQAEGTAKAREVSVQLASMLTEVGTLEVACVGIGDGAGSSADPAESAQRWRLEFQLRAPGSSEANTPSEQETAIPRWPEALERMDRIFGARSKGVAAGEARQLRAQLEQLLGSRERWTTPLLRRLFDALWQRERARRRSADHERVWLNLAGYSLRPGFGDALDDWRIEQLWPVFEAGVQHGHDAQVNAEWWTLWRRIAGGLPEAAQQRLLQDFAFNLQGAGEQRPPHLVKGSEDDMLRLGASLERIPAEHKAEIGDWLLDRLLARLKKSAADERTASSLSSGMLWTLGRLGARTPFYGSAHGVVAAEVASRWLEQLLALDWKRNEAAAFAAAHIARMSGDRSRDIGDELRERVVKRLVEARIAPSWAAMVREVVELDEAEQRQVFGESLPPGLRLVA